MSPCVPEWRSARTARLGMSIDVADFDNSGSPGIAITNFDNEMISLYRPNGTAGYSDVALKAGVGRVFKQQPWLLLRVSHVNLDGWLDLLAVNGHIDETVRNVSRNHGYAQAPLLFLNNAKGSFREAAAQAGSSFAAPKVPGPGLGGFRSPRRPGLADYDESGTCAPVSQRRCNRQQVSANAFDWNEVQPRCHRRGSSAHYSRRYADAHGQDGSSYLSQSELALTLGLGRRDTAERCVIEWPSGLVREFKNLKAGAYECVESRKLQALSRF